LLGHLGSLLGELSIIIKHIYTQGKQKRDILFWFMQMILMPGDRVSGEALRQKVRRHEGIDDNKIMERKNNPDAGCMISERFLM
jgi:hypothetical protein